MSYALRYGKTVWSYDEFDPKEPCRPNPIITFSPVRARGRYWTPNLGDRNALLILRRKMPKHMLFPVAYSEWRNSGAKEEAELGEGRAFMRWLQKNELSISWSAKDFKPHPYFCQKGAPKHDPQDEMARGLSFAIRPVEVGERKVKLYLKDEAMLSLMNLPYGKDEDFLELVMRYVSDRFQWEAWRAPAPQFLDWVMAQAKRPLFQQGQVGFRPF